MSHEEQDSWQKLGDIVERVTDRLAPVTFVVPLSGELAVTVYAAAMKSGNRPETIIAEVVRAHFGGAS